MYRRKNSGANIIKRAESPRPSIGAAGVCTRRVKRITSLINDDSLAGNRAQKNSPILNQRRRMSSSAFLGTTMAPTIDLQMRSSQVLIPSATHNLTLSALEAHTVMDSWAALDDKLGTCRTAILGLANRKPDIFAPQRKDTNTLLVCDSPLNSSVESLATTSPTHTTSNDKQRMQLSEEKVDLLVHDLFELFSTAIRLVPLDDELSLTAACWRLGKLHFLQRVNFNTDGWFIFREEWLPHFVPDYEPENAMLVTDAEHVCPRLTGWTKLLQFVSHEVRVGYRQTLLRQHSSSLSVNSLNSTTLSPGHSSCTHVRNNRTQGNHQISTNSNSDRETADVKLWLACNKDSIDEEYSGSSDSNYLQTGDLLGVVASPSENRRSTLGALPDFSALRARHSNCVRNNAAQPDRSSELRTLLNFDVYTDAELNALKATWDDAKLDDICAEVLKEFVGEDKVQDESDDLMEFLDDVLHSVHVNRQELHNTCETLLTRHNSSKNVEVSYDTAFWENFERNLTNSIKNPEKRALALPVWSQVIRLLKYEHEHQDEKADIDEDNAFRHNGGWSISIDVPSLPSHRDSDSAPVSKKHSLADNISSKFNQRRDSLSNGLSKMVNMFNRNSHPPSIHNDSKGLNVNSSNLAAAGASPRSGRRCSLAVALPQSNSQHKMGHNKSKDTAKSPRLAELRKFLQHNSKNKSGSGKLVKQRRLSRGSTVDGLVRPSNTDYSNGGPPVALSSLHDFFKDGIKLQVQATGYRMPIPDTQLALSDDECQQLIETWSQMKSTDTCMDMVVKLIKRKTAVIDSLNQASSEAAITQNLQAQELAGKIEKFLDESVQFACEGDEVALTSLCWAFGRMDYSQRLNIQTDGWLTIKEFLIKQVTSSQNTGLSNDNMNELMENAAFTSWTRLIKFLMHEVKHGYLKAAVAIHDANPKEDGSPQNDSEAEAAIESCDKIEIQKLGISDDMVDSTEDLITGGTFDNNNEFLQQICHDGSKEEFTETNSTVLPHQTIIMTNNRVTSICTQI